MAESGVTVHLVDPAEDHGPILRQRAFQLQPGAKFAEFSSLCSKLAERSAGTGARPIRTLRRCGRDAMPRHCHHVAGTRPASIRDGTLAAAFINRSWSEAAWGAYENAPSGAADALVHLGRRYALPLLRYAVPLARVRGRSRADGEPGSVLVAGSGAQLLQLQRRFFASDASAESLGSCPVHALPRTLLARGASDDLILARVARPLAGLLFDRRFLRAPDLVDAWVDARDREQVWRRMNQTTRHAARVLPAAGYSWSEARDPAAFERFHDRYYLPFVAARHEELAVLRKRPVLRRCFRRGSVLWITQDGEEVAGVLQRVDGRVSTHLVVGTREGDLEARSGERSPPPTCSGSSSPSGAGLPG